MKRVFRPIIRVLRSVGLLMGRLNTFLLIAISFYLILLPMGLVRRLCTRKTRATGWIPRAALDSKHFEKQF